MKKKIIVIFCIIVMFTLSRLIISIQPISSSDVEIRINSTDLNKSEREQIITSITFVTELNEILSNKLYYKQRIIDTWSRSEIEYEINIYEYTDKYNIRFRLLINENEKTDTRTAYQSRLDVIHTNKNSSIFNDEYSINLNEEQVNSILTMIKKYTSR